jgi:hypothetical protein
MRAKGAACGETDAPTSGADKGYGMHVSSRAVRRRRMRQWAAMYVNGERVKASRDIKIGDRL